MMPLFKDLAKVLEKVSAPVALETAQIQPVERPFLSRSTSGTDLLYPGLGADHRTANGGAAHDLPGNRRRG